MSEDGAVRIDSGQPLPHSVIVPVTHQQAQYGVIIDADHVHHPVAVFAVADDGCLLVSMLMGSGTGSAKDIRTWLTAPFWVDRSSVERLVSKPNFAVQMAEGANDG